MKVVFFTRVCCQGVPCDHYHDALDLAVQVPLGGQDWMPVQTCSLEDLIVQPQLVLISGGWLHVVGKLAVRILLECFLVLLYAGFFNILPL